MLHTHIKAFFNQCIFYTSICSRSNSLSCSSLVDISLQAFHFKSHVLWIKNCHISFQIFISWLLESSRSCQIGCSYFVFWHRTILQIKVLFFAVLSRTRYVKFQALSVENLIVIKSRRCLIKTYILTRKYFIIRCPSFWSPQSSVIFEIVLNLIMSFQKIILTFKSLSIIFHCWVFHLNHFCSNVRCIQTDQFFILFKSIRVWLKYAILFCPFLFRGCQRSNWCLWFSFYCEIKFILFRFIDLDNFIYILTRIRTISWIKPWFIKSMSICSEWSKFDSLFFLLVSLFFIPILYLGFKRTMYWVIYIDVCSWTWTHCFCFFIYISFITAVKCSMHCLFCNNFVLYIIFFLLVIVLSWPWIFWISLSCKRSFNFIFPEFTSSCFGKKWLGLLSYKLAIEVLLYMIVCCFFNWYFSFVWAWSRCLLLNFRIFTIRNFRLKYFILSRRIELLLAKFFIIINTRTRIISPAQIIMGIIGLLKQFSLDFTHVELVLWMLWMNSVNIRTVCSRTYLVKSSTCVCRGS